MMTCPQFRNRGTSHNWLLYSSISRYLYAFGAHIPFWVYFLLSQSTRCITPLLGSLIVKKKTQNSHYIPSLVCTLHSTDLCSICCVSSISIILCQMLRHKPSSSTQRRWTGKTVLTASCVTCCELFFCFVFYYYYCCFCYSADTGKRGKKGCVFVFVLCAVLLHYASCDPNMYCILQKKQNKKIDVRARQRENRISHQHTEKCVSELCTKQYMEEKKCTMLPCNSIVYFFPAKKNCEKHLLDPAFSLPGF